MRQPSGYVLSGLAIFIAIVVIGVEVYVRVLPDAAPPPPPGVSIVPPAPDPSAFGWRLTAAMSAHRALVLEVETARPGDALLIAQQLVPLYSDRFDEVLLFFFEPDVQPRRATLRVQWTRSHGYVTLEIRGVA